MSKHFLFIAFLIWSGGLVAQSVTSNHHFGLGLRFQKTHNLYWENGLTASYQNDSILNRQLVFGFSYVSSRLGSAMASNALKQDEFQFSVGYIKEKPWFNFVKPIVKLNTGYFTADYESAIFDVLPHSSFILSLEPGLVFEQPSIPVSGFLSFGYNFITGDGVSGPGSLYPLFYQVSVLYSIPF